MRKRTRPGPAPAVEPAAPSPAPARGPQPSLVIGFGMSAGGLASLRTILSALPAGRGLGAVVLHHAEVGAESLAALLQADTLPLKVIQAADGMPLEPGCAYVLSTGRALSVVDGALSVKDVSHCHGLRMPIDHFLCTLAADQGRRAAGVILSGAGGDGAHGLAEIKAMGGVTAVQDPHTAELAEMPSQALEGGLADVTLGPEGIAEFLTRRLEELAALTAQQEEEAALEAVLTAVRIATGHDFHCYKRGTLERRARRRMGLLRLEGYDDYARLLRTDKPEAAALRKDLLIGVTEFFRQAEAWRVLEEKVISDLVAAAKPHSTLRIWVPACATGKEAYSLAILTAEAIEHSGKKLALQLFATDADATAVEVARTGQYAEEDMKGISQARQNRYFLRKNGRYEVVKGLRELIVFAPQDLTSDPPFSRLDLISCRNLLIYLDQSVQRKIIQLFHFALREGGYLFLGSAENINSQDNLFEPLSAKWRIYRKLGVATPVGLDLPLRPTSKSAVAIPAANTPPRLTLPAIAHQALADRFGPPAALVDRKGTLLYLYGHVEDYLQMPAGEQTGLLSDAAREGLRNRLASALLQAVSENKKVTVAARVKKDRKSVPVKVTVSPMRHPREAEGLLLVTFEEQKTPRAVQAAADAEMPHSDLRQLEDELKITREELSSTIEQLEQSNEHLKASNEEVMSANEELQSANEELETSKEELQSLNEELNAVNQRLQDKVVELEQAGNDVANLLTSGDVATIFLDRQLRVRRFTPAVTRLLSLIDSDVGRPMADITCKFRDETLLGDARQVLVDLAPAKADVRADDGTWYSRRILPYRTKDDRIEGVVITFHDVTGLKEAAESLRQSECREHERAAELAVLFEAVPTPVFIAHDPQCLHITGNPAADELLRNPRGGEASLTAPAEMKPRHFRAVKDGRELAPDELPAQRAARGEIVRDFEFDLVFDDGASRHVLGYGTPLEDEEGRPRGSVLVLLDITDRKQAEEAIRESRNQFLALLQNLRSGVALIDEHGRFSVVNPAFLRLFEIPEGSDIRNVNDRDWSQWQVYAENGSILDVDEHPVRKAALTGKPVRNAFVGVQPPSGGSMKWMLVSAEPIFKPDGRREAIICTYYDVSDRRAAEEALRESERRYRTLFGSLQEGFYLAQALFDADGRACDFTYLDVNPAFERIMGLKRDQIVGHRALELVPALKPEWLDVFSRVQLTGEPATYDTYSERFGKHFEAFAFRPAQGQFAVVVTDITERKRAEEAMLKEAKDALHLSEREFRSLAEAMPQIVWATRPDGWNIYFNQQWVDYTGMTMEESHGHGWNRPFHPDDQQRAWDAWQRATKYNEPYSLECRLRRADGEYRWWLVRGSPMLGPDGTILKWFGTCTDIEEIKRAEARVQAERRRLFEVLETLPVYVILLSPDYRVPFANRFFRERFGESNGHRCYEYLFQRTQPCDICETYTVLKTGRPHHWYWTGPDRRDYDIYDFPFTDTDGSPLILEMGIDITEQKRAQAALHEANETLEQRVAERTAELLRSNEDLQQFAYVASHDLKEPLRMVGGFLTLLEERYAAKLDEKAREYIAFAVEGAARMSQLVTDLLAYSRVTAKGYEPRTIDAGGPLEVALVNLRAAIQEAGATVTHEPLPTISGDPSQLTQLFQNLIANAVKFRSPGRPPRVHVSAARGEGHWLFCVRDNGIGIAPESTDRLFKIFERLHTRDKYPGTGIGLAICKKIVERHGGRIWVESEPAAGSTFYFTLPAEPGA